MDYRRFVRGTGLLAAPLLISGMTGDAAAQSKVVWPDVMVQLHGAGQAYIIDPKTDKVLAALPTGRGATLGSTTPDGKKVYVSNAGPGETEIVIIDLDKREVKARLKTGSRPKHGVVSPDGKWLGINHWGLDGEKIRMSFLDTATEKVVKEIGIDFKLPKVEAGKSLADYIKGVTSMHASWSYDSRYFFTSDRVDEELIIIDTKDWSVRSMAMPSQAHYHVASPDNKELWVVLEGKSRENPPMAVVLSMGDFKELARIPMPLEGQTAIEGHHGNFTQDGRHFMMLNRGPGSALTGTEMVVIDTATRKIVARLATGSTGIGHAYNAPDGRTIVVTNYGNNVITIVNATNWSVAANLEIGTGRMGHVAFTKDGRYAYVSNDRDGDVYKLDMMTYQTVGRIKTAGGVAGGGQILNVWTNVFEELPR